MKGEKKEKGSLGRREGINVLLPVGNSRFWNSWSEVFVMGCFLRIGFFFVDFFESGKFFKQIFEFCRKMQV
jgi:hypothetical protein